MEAADLLASMETARELLERASELLTKPASQSLDECLEKLGSAAARIESFRTGLRGHEGNQVLLAEAGRLRQAVHHAGFLMNTAADYHMKWFQILRATLGGYTAQGGPAEVSCAARVCLRG